MFSMYRQQQSQYFEEKDAAEEQESRIENGAGFQLAIRQDNTIRSTEYRMREFLLITKALAMYLAVAQFKLENRGAFNSKQTLSYFLPQTVTNIVELVLSIPAIEDQIDIIEFQQQYAQPNDFLKYFESLDLAVIDEIYTNNHNLLGYIAHEARFFGFAPELMQELINIQKPLLCKIINGFLGILRDETQEEIIEFLDENTEFAALLNFEDLLSKFLSALSIPRNVASLTMSPML